MSDTYLFHIHIDIVYIGIDIYWHLFPMCPLVMTLLFLFSGKVSGLSVRRGFLQPTAHIIGQIIDYINIRFQKWFNWRRVQKIGPKFDILSPGTFYEQICLGLFWAKADKKQDFGIYCSKNKFIYIGNLQLFEFTRFRNDFASHNK